MEGIRAFTGDDIAAVVKLHGRSFGPQARFDESDFQAYLAEMFFDHPWADANFPSLLYETGGEIVAFIGVVPRPMEFRGQGIRVVVGSQLMADPAHCPPMVPFKLLRHLFSGSQDLTLSDGATREAARLWVASGGSTTPLYDFHWTYVIRPARALLDRVAGRSRSLARCVRAIRPLAWAADAGLTRILRTDQAETEQLEARPLEPRVILDELPRIRRRFSLVPAYDEMSLGWILEQARRKEVFGPLHSAALSDGEGQLSGWHMRYQTPGGPAEVLQVYARPGQETAVFQHLVHEARAAGAPLVRGRTEPSLAWAITDARGLFAPRAPITLCHSRSPEILSALRGGEGFFTRLEGEWWQRFPGG